MADQEETNVVVSESSEEELTPEQKKIRSAEKQAAAQKAWRAKNADKVKGYQASWRSKNPDAVKSAHAKYQANNPEKVAEWHRKSAAKRQALIAAGKAALEAQATESA